LQFSAISDDGDCVVIEPGAANTIRMQRSTREKHNFCFVALVAALDAFAGITSQISTAVISAAHRSVHAALYAEVFLQNISIMRPRRLP
jgi:hypothetical protein